MSCSKSGAAELVVQRGLHDAEELANTNLAAAHPVARHDHAGESGDQGAVEIEERADFRPGRARVDLGHRAGQPDVAAIAGPVVGGAHDGELPLGEGGWSLAAGSAKDAGVARPLPPSASTSLNPASRHRAQRSSSVTDARSYRVVTVHMPPREINTVIIATPGSGPIPYCRNTFAPAMNVSPP